MDRFTSDLETRVSILQGTPIFSALNQDENKELASASAMRRYLPQEFIFFEGNPPDYFFILVEGQVRVVKSSPSGKDFVVAFFGSGEMFGEVAVFEDKPYPASAQADSEVTVLAIPAKALVKFLVQRPNVALRIIDVLGARLREAQSRLRDMATERVEQRIAAALLMLAAKLGPSLPFTRQDLAGLTGTTTETTIRTINRLKDRGLIDTARGKITIADKEGLQSISEAS